MRPEPSDATHENRRWLHTPMVWIAVVALLVRLGAVVMVIGWDQPPSDKTNRYDVIALSLLEGGGFAIDGQPTASSPPLYPLLQACVYGVFGNSATALRTVLALIDVLHCLLWVIIARELFSEREAVLTGIAVALCPYFIYMVVTAGNDSLFLFLHAVFLVLLLRTIRNPNVVGAAATGIAVGLATLCRAVSLLQPLFMAPALLLSVGRERRRWIGTLLVLLAAFGATLLPWTVRNYVHFHRLVPVQTLGGYHLFIAAFDRTDPEFQNQRAEMQRGDRRGVEKDHELARQSVRQVLRNPGRFLGRMAERAMKMWFVTHSGRFSRGLIVTNSVLLALAAVGVFMTRGRWRILLPVYAAIAYYILLHSTLFAIFRYMMPVIPLLLMFASVTVVAALGRAGIRMGAHQSDAG